MNGEASGVDAVGAFGELVAVEINLHQTRCGDFVEHQAIGVDQKMMLRPRDPRRNVSVDQIVPAVMRDQAIACGEIDPLVPFSLGHIRGQFLQASFRW